MRQFQFESMRTVSMPTKIAMIVFGLILFLPIFALLVLAGTVAAVVFGVLIVFGVVIRKIRSLASGKDTQGRKNVRVKR